MDSVYNLMQDVYEIHTREKSDVPLARPKWKDIYNTNYKYYYGNDVEVDFNLPENKLTVYCAEYGFKDEYTISYPRYTSRGNSEDSKFFHFFFSVVEEKSSSVIIIRANNITNFNELYDSKHRVEVKSEKDFLGKKEILNYQETIYRNLGLGIAIKDIEPSKDDLDELGLTKPEFIYAVCDLIIKAESFYLASRFRSCGSSKDKYLQILNDILEDEIVNIDNCSIEGLTRSDYITLKILSELKVQNKNRKRMLQTNRNEFQMSLKEISQKVEKLIYLDEIYSMKLGLNVVETLKVYGFEVKDINICETTTKLVSRIGDTKLSIVEMLEIILNHKRNLHDALKLEEIRKNLRLGMAIV